MTMPADQWRQHLALGLGKVVMVNDGGTVQTAQVQLSAAETRDNTPMMHNFGHEANPPPGTDVLYVALGGDRSKAVGIATNHQSSRLKGLVSGGARTYDAGGRQVLLDNDGLIKLFAPGEVLHRLVTDVFMQLFNAHTHGGVQPGGASTTVPNQQMSSAHLTTATRGGT